MIAKHIVVIASLTLAATLATGACASRLNEIALERRVASRLDVSRFSRVLIAGFLAGGTEDFDVNLETVRLLRSQLRHRTKLAVINADVFPLGEVAAAQTAERETPAAHAADSGQSSMPYASRPGQDMEVQEAIFADAASWKRVGEEYLNPLIVTGALRFTPQSRQGIQTTARETFDSAGRRQIERVPQFLAQKGFVLSARFVFIDGATGAVLHTERFSEGVLYGDQQSTPALASYFELMDRLVPNVLGLVAPQTVRTTRTLLR